MANMNDVAEHAGVSVATVSNVITGKRPVSEKKRKLVLASIKALDYQVNLVARGLKTQKTAIIGLILPDITKLFFQGVLTGIFDTASQSGYRLNILSSGYNFETERTLLNTLRSGCVDGVILDSCAPISESKKWATELIEESTLPIILLENSFNTDKISSVTVDNEKYSHMIAQHLIDIGRRKILYIAGPTYIEHEYARLQGYRACLACNGIPFDPHLEKCCTYMSESGYNAVCEALNEGLVFDAVQASNDQEAIGALKALKERGFRVPEDIAVAGFDNLFPATLVSPALTTISVPNYEMGACATSQLIRQMSDPSAAPASQTLPAELIIRASTCPASESSWDLSGW